MSLLKKLDEQTTHRLQARTLIGRSRHCALRVRRPEVSGEHAVLRYADNTWAVRDLASRNGTLRNGTPVAPGEWVPLEEGDVIAFGHPDNRFRLVDASPPVAAALPVDGGEPVEAVEGLLLLPDEHSPEATVHRDADGQWVLDDGDALRPVHDGTLIELGGRGWTLFLPEGVVSTAQAAALRPTLDVVRLRFEVSRDEEHVRLTAFHGDRPIELGDRAHHYTLLTLARLRLEDQGLPDAEQGWVDQPRLLRMLAIDPSKLNLDVFRARRQLADAGIGGAAALVERRTYPRQLRFGVVAVEVTPLGDADS
ncbi:MAG: FHA domain-containing protein [Alphaproteobacteria bacterium]|nr:FHA domain-containing protein [Alphaproteobacteria bacterium]